MAKQLPRYEGLLNPQPIEIELRGRLPSYDVDKAIQKYPFSMDIPSIEELKEKKRKLFKKIPEDTIFRRHIPKQVELDKFIDALKEKVIHDYNIPISVKALRAEYKRSPYSRDIEKYIRTGYCSYVGKHKGYLKCFVRITYSWMTYCLRLDMSRKTMEIQHWCYVFQKGMYLQFCTNIINHYWQDTPV